MKKSGICCQFKKVMAIATVAGLVSCNTFHDEPYRGYTEIYYDGMYSPNSYYQSNNYDNYEFDDESQVRVPNSYHVGQYHSPVSHKSRDLNWVGNQNPNAYTIEISDGDNAAKVAGKLSEAPKTHRMGQVKYYNSGKTYYKGLYGSFGSYEAAKEAMDKMPPNIKNNAVIKQWNKIQTKM